MSRSLLKTSGKVLGTVGALFLSLAPLTGCGEEVAKTAKHSEDAAPGSGFVVENEEPILPIAPTPAGAFDVGIMELMVRTDPINPQNERFLDDWRLEAYNIDDQGRQLGPVYYGETGPGGNAALPIPGYMYGLPLVVNAYNDAYPLADADGDGIQECRNQQIFIPPNCADKALWLVGPVEDALWRFYKELAAKRGEAWNPSQVDCATWLANLQLLIGTDKIDDALEALSNTDPMIFDDLYLERAFQENQQLLVPTRPPICMAERRHAGGGMQRGEQVSLQDFPYNLDDSEYPALNVTDVDPLLIGSNGIVDSICGEPFDGELRVNGATFVPSASFLLDEDDFLGLVHDQQDLQPKMDVSTYNVRLGNGRELEADKYDDACSLTNIIKFTNKDDDEQDVLLGTGVYFTDLFDNGVDDVDVWLTSDGDRVVDSNDYWAIFKKANLPNGDTRVITVSLLGHRDKDFRDVLYMQLNGDDLFIGLRADYELNEEASDGEDAYLGYTITTWSGVSVSDEFKVRENISNCYEAADVWTRQFFITKDFQTRADDCCVNDRCTCEIADLITPLEAAEFAVRSQCFSNSRANQKWQVTDVGLWSMNTIHGVEPNLVINPGWLAPNLDFEIFIQKFDEAPFKGPITVRRTDECGQLIAAIPTLTEGDRVMIRSEDNCCDDYKLVLPCVPEFTGFIGAPGIPFVSPYVGAPIAPPVAVGPAFDAVGVHAEEVAHPEEAAFVDEL